MFKFRIEKIIIRLLPYDHAELHSISGSLLSQDLIAIFIPEPVHVIYILLP